MIVWRALKIKESHKISEIITKTEDKNLTFLPYFKPIISGSVYAFVSIKAFERNKPRKIRPVAPPISRKQPYKPYFEIKENNKIVEEEPMEVERIVKNIKRKFKFLLAKKYPSLSFTLLICKKDMNKIIKKKPKSKKYFSSPKRLPQFLHPFFYNQLHNCSLRFPLIVFLKYY